MSGRSELVSKVAHLIHQRSGHIDNHSGWGGCYEAAEEIFGLLPPDLVKARADLEELGEALRWATAEIERLRIAARSTKEPDRG